MNKSTIHIEPIVFIVRGFTDGRRHGDPFQYTFTITKAGHTACIHGMLGGIDNAILLKLAHELVRLGFKNIQFSRIKNNEERNATVDLLKFIKRGMDEKA